MQRLRNVHIGVFFWSSAFRQLFEIAEYSLAVHNLVTSFFASRNYLLDKLFSELTTLDSLFRCVYLTILISSGLAGLIIEKVEVENPPNTLVGIFHSQFRQHNQDRLSYLCPLMPKSIKEDLQRSR